VAFVADEERICKDDDDDDDIRQRVPVATEFSERARPLRSSRAAALVSLRMRRFNLRFDDSGVDTGTFFLKKKKCNHVSNNVNIDSGFF
jgi:hypothetical protein